MIYDPITRQTVTIIGRYPPDHKRYRWGQEERGQFQFARVRYGEHLPGFSGGFDVGHERDLEINDMVADDGIREIHQAYEAAAEVSE